MFPLHSPPQSFSLSVCRILCFIFTYDTRTSNIWIYVDRVEREINQKYVRFERRVDRRRCYAMVSVFFFLSAVIRHSQFAIRHSLEIYKRLMCHVHAHRHSTPFGIRAMFYGSSSLHAYTWASNDCKKKKYIWRDRCRETHHRHAHIVQSESVKGYEIEMCVVSFIARFFVLSSEDDTLRCHKSPITWKRWYTIDIGSQPASQPASRLIVCRNE